MRSVYYATSVQVKKFQVIEIIRCSLVWRLSLPESLWNVKPLYINQTFIERLAFEFSSWLLQYRRSASARLPHIFLSASPFKRASLLGRFRCKERRNCVTKPRALRRCFSALPYRQLKDGHCGGALSLALSRLVRSVLCVPAVW